MKQRIFKRLSALLALVLLFSATPLATQAEIACGDVNQDGIPNASDALLILKHNVGTIVLSEEVLSAGDVNQSNSVDVIDALILVQYSVKLIDFIPIDPEIAAGTNSVGLVLDSPKHVLAGNTFTVWVGLSKGKISAGTFYVDYNTDALSIQKRRIQLGSMGGFAAVTSANVNDTGVMCSLAFDYPSNGYDYTDQNLFGINLTVHEDAPTGTEYTITLRAENVVCAKSEADPTIEFADVPLEPITVQVAVDQPIIPSDPISGTTGDCTWTLDGTVLTISGEGAMGDYSADSPAPWPTSITQVVIEEGVATIGNNAFRDCSDLTTVTIPTSVTSIGFSAFYNCPNLPSVTIPDSVNSIGSSAFWGTAYYDDSTNWENGVLYIGKHLIKADSFLLNSSEYAIKEGTLTIADYAFESCFSLTSVAIPDSVTSIGHYAFEYCENLDTITIPNSVTRIGSCAFEACTDLTEVTIADSVNSIGYDAFHRTAYYDDSTNWENGVLYIGKHLIEVSSSLMHLSEYTVKEGTLTIADYAFSTHTHLATVTIPNSVTSIGYCAFENCRSLTDIWYQGSESDKAKMSVGSGNEDLTSATWHYSRIDTPITSSQYTIADNQISQITEGTTVEELLAGIDQGATCQVVKDGVLLSKDTPIGTGMVVQIMDGDTVKGFCTIVVEGDNDGDSTINAKDALLALQHTVKLKNLQDAYASAADVDESSKIDAKDALLVLQYAVKLIDSFEK